MTGRRPGLVRLNSTSAAGAGVDTVALKEAVREMLRLGDRHTVMVQQLACAEPGCPPVETVVAVLAAGDPPRRWTIHKPLSDVTADDIRTALTPGDHS
jgi:hypothetical protein